MEFDLIYPENKSKAVDAECVIAAVFFDEDELLSFGVKSDSPELDDAFYNFNQFEKAFELWSSPQYLSDFFDQFKSFFQVEYWHNISEFTFQSEVSTSLNEIRKRILDAMENNKFHELVLPLEPDEEDKRIYKSIRVKLKQGTIIGHYPFRFYAIEVEEKKCYLITGATIKVHKDMKQADNTKIELQKLEYTLEYINENDLDSKDIFVTNALEQNNTTYQYNYQ